MRSLTLARILAALEATKGNKVQAAERLGIDRNKLDRWLKQ